VARQQGQSPIRAAVVLGVGALFMVALARFRRTLGTMA
jgi:hypothetical protein